MRDIAVACGDVPPAVGRKGASLVLDVEPTPGARRLNLRVEQLTRAMVQNLPARLADLLEIACYVYCADQFSRRDSTDMPGLGEDWRRAFAFRIAVRDPAFWNAPGINRQLAATLGFLSEDRYDFTFLPTQRQPGGQTFLDLHGDGPPGGFRPERVLLFSGGLDSLAGAAEALLRDRVPVALVSHHSSSLARQAQRTLVDALRERAGPASLLHVSVRVNKGGHDAREATQRTRAFLFATLGFLVAHLLRHEEVSFCENGVVSVNLPLAGHVLGTRATRTTHPRVLQELGDLFSAVASREVRVVNPLFWSTKAEVVRAITAAGCGGLIPHSFSCAQVRKATMQLGTQHCGVCSQCVDRRFAVLAAGASKHEPASQYAVELFRGERQSGAEVVLAESYVLSAYRHARSDPADFLTSHGELFRVLHHLGMPVADALRELHQLHVRHAREVEAVLAAELRSGSPVADRLELSDRSLLAMVQAPASSDVALVDPVQRAPAVSAQVASESTPRLTRPRGFALDAANGRVVFEEGPVLEGALRKLVAALVPAFVGNDQAGTTAVRPGEFVTAPRLAAALGIEEPTLRRHVSRLRLLLHGHFLEHAGSTIADDDVLQNHRSRGYRLNPLLVLEPRLLSRLGGGPEGRVTQSGPGVTMQP